MQKAAAAMQMRLVAIARSSRRSAPAIRFLCAPHWAISSPAAAASVPRPDDRDEDQLPAAAAADQPGEQGEDESARERDDR